MLGIEAATSSYKVLLVDDSADFLDLFRVYARKLRIEVLTAENGKDALVLLAKHRFDTIVLDFMLPDLSGLEICELLHCDETYVKNHQTPTIIVSAVTVPTHKLKQLYRTGAQLFLPKSFGLRELMLVVESSCFAATVKQETASRDRYELTPGL